MEILIANFCSSNTWMFVPLLCVWAPSYFILAGSFGSMRLHGRVSIIQFFPFPLTVFNCIIIIIIANSTISSVLVKSNKLHAKLKRNMGRLQLTGNKWKTARNRYLYKASKSLKPFGVLDETGRPVRNVRAGHTFLFLADSLITLLVSFPQDNFSNV